MHYAIYIASVLGAVSLLLMMPRDGYNPRKIGAVLGAATLGGLWLWLYKDLPKELGMPRPAIIYYYIFSAIAIASAARVITHNKPVFAALWFVLLVAATAGLFLILSADFIAFAMLIIYGGAILVTYVFVIMLASQAEDPERVATEAPEYDRVAREPVAAIAAGFLLLAALLTVCFDHNAAPNQWLRPSDMEANLRHRDAVPAVASDASDRGKEDWQKLADATPSQGVKNVEAVGLDLFQSHPLGLELAGVILLVSLIGAVVIARKKVEGPEESLPGPTGTTPTAEPGPKSVETLTSTQVGGTSVG